MKYGFVYLWYDRKSKRFYIGSHWGTYDDGYICSSRWMRNAYRRRPHDFKRRIVSQKIQDRKSLLIEEHRWLQLIPVHQLGKRYYNLTNHLNGHWAANSEKYKGVSEKISNTMRARHQDPEYQKIFKEGRVKAAIANTGKQRDGEYRKFITEFHNNRSKETREKISKNNKRLHAEGKIGMRGRNHTNETKSKQSEAAKNRPILECPHCHKTTNVRTNYNRWHGANCREINK